MLILMATFVEYERGLIQERARTGVNVANACGGGIGRPVTASEKTARNFRAVQHLIDSESHGVVEVAKMVGWPKAT